MDFRQVFTFNMTEKQLFGGGGNLLLFMKIKLLQYSNSDLLVGSFRQHPMRHRDRDQMLAVKTVTQCV